MIPAPVSFILGRGKLDETLSLANRAVFREMYVLADCLIGEGGGELDALTAIRVNEGPALVFGAEGATMPANVIWLQPRLLGGRRRQDGSALRTAIHPVVD